jgi:bifunctional DNA-binding transcriptional regulator/antitoxin component of YhaV-PrlF toxin-antitoxin module
LHSDEIAMSNSKDYINQHLRTEKQAMDTAAQSSVFDAVRELAAGQAFELARKLASSSAFELATQAANSPAVKALEQVVSSQVAKAALDRFANSPTANALAQFANDARSMALAQIGNNATSKALVQFANSPTAKALEQFANSPTAKALKRLANRPIGEMTVSDRIRALAFAEMPRNEIAKELGVRYQHVRNVLVQDEMREAKGADVAAASGASENSEGLSSMKVRLGPDGRVVIPAVFREAVGAKEGDVFFARLENGEIHLLTPNAAMARTRSMLRKFIPEDVSLVDELIEERRREAKRELEE